ncbi:MAG: aspartate kinase [Coriobacteriia bacterium]|nr:aspartate kinase [Coriobacteriia bacterium]
MSNFIVCKFGGTSVATSEGREALACKVQEHLEADARPVLVVSAMGRMGEPYATDTLLSVVAGLPANDREYDLLSSVGEVISAVKIAHELRDKGIDAHAFTGAEAGIVTDDTAKDARILSVCPAALIEAAEQGVVPVVCGFQGISTSGHLTTLGRGGSDTTACALGVALDASVVEIYSDVDGVMTADPREVEAAQVIDVLEPDELYQLVRMGSRIVHTPAAELAQKSGVNLLVKNTYSNHPGTVVRSMEVHRSSDTATAIVGKSGITRFIVDLGHEEGCSAHIEAQASIYKAIAEAAVSLDMFTPAGNSLYFTVDSADTDKVADILRELDVKTQCTEGLAKVTVIGAAMHGIPGVMSRIAAPLAQAGIDVWQTADSHATISVLVREVEAQQAQVVLHTALNLDGGHI